MFNDKFNEIEFIQDEDLKLVVENGNLDKVKYFCECILMRVKNINSYLLLIVKLAEKRNHLDIIYYVIGFYLTNIKHIMYNHMIHNNNELNFLKSINNKLFAEIVKYACVHMVELICKQMPIVYFDPNFNHNMALKKSVFRGNFKVFEYLFKLAITEKRHYSCKLLPQDTMRKIAKLAAVHGRVDIIKFILKYPDVSRSKTIDKQIILIILKEIASRPFLESKISHVECRNLITHLIVPNLYRISIKDLSIISNKIETKKKHTNYDLKKQELFIEYVNKLINYIEINIKIIAVVTMCCDKSIPVEGIGFHIITYLYKPNSNVHTSLMTLDKIKNKILDKKCNGIFNKYKKIDKLNTDQCNVFTTNITTTNSNVEFSSNRAIKKNRPKLKTYF